MPGLRNTLHEWAAGNLHSGSPSGPIVTDQKQAIAIGMNDQPPAKPKAKKKSKFKHHHAAAGAAFEKGDTQTAMHHVGHMLTALRTGRGNEEMGETAPDTEAGEPQAPMSIRSRLSGMQR